MSSSAKIALAVIVIVIIAVAAYYLWPTGSSTYSPQAYSGDNSALSSGNSDSNLAQDSATIDSQMSALGSDTASMNQSFSDTPVQQSY